MFSICIKFQRKWNLALIIKNDVNGKYGKLHAHQTGDNDELYDDVLTEIRKDLMAHDFIKQMQFFPYTENLSLTRFHNLYLTTMNWLITTYPDKFQIKFTDINIAKSDKKVVEKLCGQKAIIAGGRKRMIMVNVMKQKDAEAWAKYENAMFKYLPQIGTELFSRGTADSSYWDDVALVSYRSRAKFCKMALSEELLKVLPFKHKGLLDTHTYMSYQIIECSEKINGCAPTDD